MFNEYIRIAAWTAIKKEREAAEKAARLHMESMAYRAAGQSALAGLGARHVCAYCRSPHNAQSCPNCGGPI